MPADSFRAPVSHGNSPADSSFPSRIIRLPRLDALDTSKAGRDIASDHVRNRSASSASRHIQSSHPDSRAAFSSFPPHEELWSVPARPVSLGTSQTAAHLSPGGLPDAEKARLFAGPSTLSSPTAPQLPEPHRRSTMLSGALPPLAALQIPSLDRSYRPFMQPIRKEADSAVTAPAGSADLRPPSVSRWNSSSSSSSYFGQEGSPGHLDMPHGVSHPLFGQPQTEEAAARSRKVAKVHVSSACLNCKKAHLACDAERPCKRCLKLGKTATCVDVQHKKRGRPRLKERENAASSGSLRASPRLLSSDSTDSGWSPSIEPPGQFTAGGATLPAWSSSPEAQEARPPLPLAPSGTRSTFSAASQELMAMDHSTSHQVPLVTTIVCGTDLIAEYVSQESQVTFGLSPALVCHRSLLTVVHPEDANRLYNAWGRLIDPVGLGPSPFPRASLDTRHRTNCKLFRPARGTIFVEDRVRMRTAERHFISCSVRLHLGGALGLDLYRPETKEYAFVVCSIVPFNGRSPEAVASSLHPDTARITAADFPLGDGQGIIVFRSPVSSPPLTRMATFSVQSSAPPEKPQQQVQQQRGLVSHSPSMWTRTIVERPHRKHSPGGVPLHRPATSSSSSSPLLRTTPPVSTLNVSGPSFKSHRPHMPNDTLPDSKTLLAAIDQRNSEADRIDVGSGNPRLYQPQWPDVRMAQGQVVSSHLQYGAHRPFSSAAPPFSTLGVSLMRPTETWRGNVTPDLNPSRASRRSGERLVYAADESKIFTNQPLMDQSPSAAAAAAAAASMLHIRGTGGVRLTGSVSTSRSTQSVADGMGTVAC